MEPGRLIDAGKYRIVRPLGSGGMGAVYEALNTQTRKRVAIKCLLPSHALTNPSATGRLLREAEAACRVRHPNVVDVYDLVRDGDELFLVMEYLEGEPLTAALERGELPLPNLLNLLLPAMRAVAAAHAQGVVHRDIKPDNIFLARQTDVSEPVPKVLDFGISKLDARGTKHATLTETGAAIGTPMYMAYEQLLGANDVDGRADVYAFGVVLYEALTGRPPYTARSHAEWVLMFAAPPVSPKALRAEIPSALDKLVMWCLESDRDKRVPSMEVLVRELTPFASEHSARKLLTLPSQTCVASSKVGLTPAEAAAALLERIQAGNTPKPAAAVTPGHGARARELMASQGASTRRASTRGRGWMVAGLVVVVVVVAAALAWERSRSEVAVRPRETSLDAATRAPEPSAPTPPAGVVREEDTPPSAADVVEVVPTGVSERRVPEEPQKRHAGRVQKPVVVVPPTAAPQPVLPPDRGIY